MGYLLRYYIQVLEQKNSDNYLVVDSWLQKLIIRSHSTNKKVRQENTGVRSTVNKFEQTHLKSDCLKCRDLED